MSNLFVNLPMPALNGAGAAVDTSGMGADKTIVVSGSFENCTVAIEVSTDGGTQFAPICSFQSGSLRKEQEVAATHMRVNVSGRVTGLPFSANADVGCNDGGTLNAVLPMPVLNGAGASVDVSALGTFNTIEVSGTFPRAAVLIEASEDGSAWAPVCQFSGQGGLWSGDVTGNFMRTRVSGRASGGVFTNVSAAVCAANDPVTSGSSTAGGDRGWYGTGIDGAHVTAGNETLTRDRFYTTLTVLAGHVLSTGGFKIACSERLTIEDTGFVDNSGTSGDTGGSSVPPPGGAAGTLLGGGNGAAGGVAEVATDGVAGSNASWWPIAAGAGSAGHGGAGGGGAAGAAGAAALGYGSAPYTIEQIAAGDGVGGGGGGGSGGSAANPSHRGKGGGGGGVLCLKARYMTVADGSIRAKGGNGGAGFGTAGGGGGGQGGVVLIITDESAAPVCNVSGGTAGAGAGTGAAGTAGSDGVVIAISPVHGPL